LAGELFVCRRRIWNKDAPQANHTADSALPHYRWRGRWSERIRMMRITLLYAASLATVLVLADARLLPAFAQHVNDVPDLDKVIHFLMFGVLALLVNLSLARRGNWPLAGAIVTGSMIVAVVATAEELSNLLVAAREYSLGDLAANYLGVLCVGVVPLWNWRRRPAA
jgi:VanZ family protein